MAELMKKVFYSATKSQPSFEQHHECQFSTFTAVSPVKLTPNEDCAGWIRLAENHWVFLVADGLGGLPAGDTASTLAIQVILDALENREMEDVSSALLIAIDSANQTILEHGNGGATTLAAVEMDHHVIRPYHIGDSTITVTGQRGAVKFNSVSHSPTGYMEEAGLLSEMEAMLHHERNLVSNVLGSEEMRIEVGPKIPLQRYDTVVIASDGLCDNLYQHQIIESIRKGPLDSAVSNMVDECRNNMLSGSTSSPNHPDDLTILAFRRNS